MKMVIIKKLIGLKLKIFENIVPIKFKATIIEGDNKMNIELKEAMDNLDETIKDSYEMLNNLDEAMRNVLDILNSMKNKTDAEQKASNYLQEEYERTTCAGGLEDMFNCLKWTLESYEA